MIKLSPAFGFLLLGWMLGQLPEWAPGWCAVAGAGGGGARLLWLQLMSWLQLGIAAGYFLRNVSGVLGRALRYEPARGVRGTKETPKRALRPANGWARAALRPRRTESESVPWQQAA